MKADMAVLKSRFAQIDNTIAKPLDIAALIIMLLGVGILIWNLIQGNKASLNFLPFYSGAILLSLIRFYVVRKCKEVVLDIYGLRCLNCKKTPIPSHFFVQANHAFCPHCQLKYEAT